MAWGSPWHPLWCRPVRSRRKVRKDQQVQPASWTYLVNNMPCKYKSVGISLPIVVFHCQFRLRWWKEINHPQWHTKSGWYMLVENPPNLEASPMGRASSAFRIWFRTLWTCSVRDDPSVSGSAWNSSRIDMEGTMYTFKIIQRKIKKTRISCQTVNICQHQTHVTCLIYTQGTHHVHFQNAAPCPLNICHNAAHVTWSWKLLAPNPAMAKWSRARCSKTQSTRPLMLMDSNGFWLVDKQRNCWWVLGHLFDDIFDELCTASLSLIRLYTVIVCI